MSHKPRVKKLLIALAIIATATATACGEGACEGYEPSGSANAPSISQIRLVNQLNGDPWTSIFGLKFSDQNGDLGTENGYAQFFVNSKPQELVTLLELFQGVGLSSSATSGELAVPLRFSENIKDGASATLGVQLIDKEGLRSNCYALELDFSVSSLSN